LSGHRNSVAEKRVRFDVFMMFTPREA
jgi:hypothetical protein